jgi:putative glycerol-1-phosphate prenyltransferase
VSVYQKLLNLKQKGEKGLLILLDPDKSNLSALCQRAELAETAGAKALLIGGSYLKDSHFDEVVKNLKSALKSLPLIIFPGGSSQVSQFADAILFLALISGRNPQYLIGEHISAAPKIKKIGLEAIPTAYMLVEAGKTTAIEFISNTKPIPRDQISIAVAHAIAGEMLGMKLIYLEAGSGAEVTVPADMVSAVKENIDLPLIVGGGIRSPEQAQSLAQAGADLIVIGNALESERGLERLSEFISAIT